MRFQPSEVCRNGHPRTVDNTGRYDSKWQRSCRVCRIAHAARQSARKRAMSEARDEVTRTREAERWLDEATKFSVADLAWAAGLFEGEGTVSIRKPGRRSTGSLIASVVNTDREVLDWFQARWPGYFKAATGLDPLRQRPAWVWLVAAQDAAAFLVAIRPFIVRTHVMERIDHAVRFQVDKSSCPHINRSYDYAEEQWAAYLWMRDLNVRGVRKAA